MCSLTCEDSLRDFSFEIQIRSILHADPLYTPTPLASVYGAVHAVNAITMALLARVSSGEGDIVEVSSH